MTSYKKLYLESQRSITNFQKIPYNCPECNSQLQMSISEIICSNEKCKFDKTLGELLPRIMDTYDPGLYNPEWEKRN